MQNGGHCHLALSLKNTVLEMLFEKAKNEVLLFLLSRALLRALCLCVCLCPSLC